MRSTDELIENLNTIRALQDAEIKSLQARLTLTEAVLSAAVEYIECIESFFVPDAWIRPSVHGEYTAALDALGKVTK